MPIDRKWLRNHPDQVEEWQRLRGLPREIVQTAFELDQTSLQLLFQADRCRERLNTLRQQLRSNRDCLLQEQRNTCQVQLQALEEQYLEANGKLLRILYKLASPMDGYLCEQFPIWKGGTPQPVMMGVDFHSHAAWHLYRAMIQYAHEFFGRKYSNNHSMSNNNERHVDKDWMHAMWGCTAVGLDDERSDDNNITPSSSCPICAGSQGDQDETLLLSPPAWITWLAQSMPRKSIWGSKQVPRFTILRGGSTTTTSGDTGKVSTKKKIKSSNKKQHKVDSVSSSSLATSPVSSSSEQETIELLAMTASSTWDARQVQLELAHELVAFYQTLLVSSSQKISIQAVDPSQLHRHEQSRLVVVLETAASNDTNLLGWVSNFGDSASRACDISFKGGGLADAKDKVYLVHATIVGPNTISRIVQCNFKAGHDVIHIPVCLQAYMGAVVEMEKEDQGTMAIPLKALGPSKASDSVLSPSRPRVNLVAAAASPEIANGGIQAHGTSSSQRPSLYFALIDAGKPQCQAQIRNEALSCPYGFLLDTN